MQPVRYERPSWPHVAAVAAGWTLALSIVLLLPVVAAAGGHTADASLEYDVTGLSPGRPFAGPLGVFYDATRDECYVADTGNHQVVVCDRNGVPVSFFRTELVRDGETVPGEPRSLAVDDQGRVFVVDNVSPELGVFDQKGRRIASIPAPGADCPKPHAFEQVALGPDGRIYAAISCAPRLVAVIGADLQVERVVPLDRVDESHACITGLALGPSGNIYVTDACAKEMVQVFDEDGHLVREFGKHNHAFRNFSFASGIAVMDDGDMWVSDAVRGTVSRFSADGKFIAYVGGSQDQPLVYPSDVATDGSHRIFVIERSGNRLQCFDLEAPAHAAGGARP